jgi:hypothetical protein
MYSFASPVAVAIRQNFGDGAPESRIACHI